MSEYETLLIDRVGAVDWVTMNRHDKLNAINAQMFTDLWDYFGALRNDYSRRVVVLRGAGRGFCSGLDLSTAPNPTKLVPRAGHAVAGPTATVNGVIRAMRA